MKKTIYTLFVMLLVGCTMASSQINPIIPPKITAPKKKQTPRKEQTPRSGKSRSSSNLTQVQKDRIIRQTIEDMVWVAGSMFTMGSSSVPGKAVPQEEKPAHIVNISGFYISRYEVTRELWLAVMDSISSSENDDPRMPIECVTWNKCQEFIIKLNALTGKKFRLPTEAEWEYAARGGSKSKGYKYSGSNLLDRVAWYYENSHSTMIHTVGSKSPNELGLYDMSGNVKEWCYDWYCTYSSEPQTNPTGPSSGYSRVFRGGSWVDYAEECSVSYRDHFPPTGTVLGLGMRLAMSSDK